MFFMNVSKIVSVIIFNLFIQTLYGGDTLLLSKDKLCYNDLRMAPSAFSDEDFNAEVQSLLTSDDYTLSENKKLRLETLQNHVWNGHISPYCYQQGLKILALHMDKADFTPLKSNFENKLKSLQSLLDSNFQKDLLSFLENVTAYSSFVEFEELLSYYKILQNPFDYTNTLTQFGALIQKNQTLNEDQRKALGSIILQTLRQIDSKTYRKIEAERNSTESALEELPFHKESLPKGFNSSLPTQKIETIEEKSISFGSALKGLAFALYKGARYALSHPKKMLSLGLAATLTPTAAQINNAFFINQVGPVTDQSELAITTLNNGNVFVAWAGSATFGDIYGRFFSPNGTGLDNEFIINQIGGCNGSPSVTGLSNNNVFVVWYRNQMCAGIDVDIYGIVLNPNGIPLGNEFIINKITSGASQLRPTITHLPNDNVFVAWEDYLMGGGDLYGSFFLSDGTAMGNEFSIHNRNGTNTAFLPTVAASTTGNVFVAWDGNDNNHYGKIVTLIDPTAGNEFMINQNTSNENNARVSLASLINGNLFATWYSHQAGTYYIYGRIFHPDGTPLENEFIIDQTTLGIRPSATILMDGNILVVWDGATAQYAILGRVFFPNGTALGNTFPIYQNSSLISGNPAVTGLTKDNVFAAWFIVLPGNSINIYGSIFSYSDLVASISFSNPSATLPSTGESTESLLIPSTISTSNPLNTVSTNPSSTIAPSQFTESSAYSSDFSSETNSVTNSQISSTASLTMATPSPSLTIATFGSTASSDFSSEFSSATDSVTTSQIVPTNSLTMATPNPSSTLLPSEQAKDADFSSGFSNRVSW